MKNKFHIIKGDRVLWMVFLLLTIVSLVAVYSAIGWFAVGKMSTTPARMFVKHLAMVLASYVAVIGVSHADFKWFSSLSRWGFVGSLFVLAFVAISGTRWAKVPLIGQFQPSEVAKICAIIYTARLLSQSAEYVEKHDVFVNLLIALRVIKNGVTEKVLFWRVVAYFGIASLIIFPENFSTAALVFLSCYIMMLFGGVNKRYWTLFFFVFMGLAVAVLYFSYSNRDAEVFRSNTWGGRIERWLHPDHDALWQENEARMAIARGKVFGVGVGNTIHARLMTQGENDFIYAIIIEETGMVGGLVLLALYCVLFFRCIRISGRCKVPFGSITVAGLGTVIFIQALANMGVAVGLFPVTGQTLPLVSYGGTAYIIMGCAIGAIQSIAFDSNLKLKQEQSQRTKSVGDDSLSAPAPSQEAPKAEPKPRRATSALDAEDIFADMDK